MNKLNNPYIGPRTFEKTERDRFFGRERETRELLTLTVSEQLVLFYAQSGAGKSSLVNTCLVPDLERKGFKVLPIGRVGGDPPPELNVDNVYIFNLISKLASNEVNITSLAHLSLCEFLTEKKYYFSSGALLEEEESDHKRIVLIIDQFEELFSTHPEQWEKHKDFFVQLAQAIQEIPHLWVVLVMREDFIASLEPYEHLLPGRLRMRYYMQRLSREAALKAVKEPVKGEGFSRPYAEAVAEKLVDDLRSMKVAGPDGKFESRLGQFVEPLILQVICYDIWKNLPPGGTYITEDDLQIVGDVNEFLKSYYARRMAEVADISGVKERKIRKWFVEELISPTGVRNMVLLDPNESKQGINDTVIRALSDLVSAEQRGGSTFYELTHDRLIEPILSENKEWEANNTNFLQSGASIWEQQGRSSGLLLRGKELRAAEVWASENRNDVSDIESQYLEASLNARREARERAGLSQQLRKRLAWSGLFSIIAIFFMIIAIFLGRQFYIANRQAKAQDLARQSEAALSNKDKDTAIVLAYQALKKYPYSGEAEAALGLALSPAKRNSISPPRGNFLDVFLSSDGTKIVTISDNGVIQYWNTADGTPSKTMMLKALISLAVFSFDGSKVLTSGGSDENAYLWDVNTGRKLVEFNEDIDGVNFSPDGTRIATTSPNNGKLTIWNSGNGKRLIQLPPAGLDNRSLSFNIDGSRIVDFENGEAWIWDATNGNKLHSLGETNYVAFSPNGTRVATFDNQNNVIIWDAETGENLTTIFFSKERLSQDDNSKASNAMKKEENWNLVFSSDDSRIIAGVGQSNIIGTSNVSVWDTKSGEKLYTLYGNYNGIDRAVFSPNGKYIATASTDHTVRVWDIEDQDEIPATGGRHDILTLRNSTNANSSAANLMFSQDNSHLLIRWDNGQIEYWSLPPSRLELLKLAEARCGACNFSYEERIVYDVHNWTMLVYDYSDFFLVLWIAPFYIILGWITYRKVFFTETSVISAGYKTGFTWRRFLSASLLDGMLAMIFLAGVLFILLPEISFEATTQLRSFGISTGESLFFLLPILIWTGGVYCHMTRNQTGTWPRTKRIFVSTIASIFGIALVSIILILFLVIGTLSTGFMLSSAESITKITSALIVYLFFGAILGVFLLPPLNFIGGILYAFGLQPLANKWGIKFDGEEDF